MEFRTPLQCHWSIPQTRLIQPTPSHSFSVNPILILSHHIRLDLQNCLLSSGFPTKTLGACILWVCACVRVWNMLHCLIMPIVFYGNWKPWSSSLCNLLWPPLTSFVRFEYLPKRPVIEHSVCFLPINWYKFHSHTKQVCFSLWTVKINSTI